MSDLPILFSAPMVRAILREIEQPGTGKTQTRRVCGLAGELDPNDIDWNVAVGDFNWRGQDTFVGNGFPRYAVGDRLYVREAWRSAAAYDDLSPSSMGGEEPIHYEADGAHQSWGYPAITKLGRFRQGMHMPRWASRLTLIVTDVRVQRLQEISEADARAEGVEPIAYDGDDPQFVGQFGWKDYDTGHPHSVVPFRLARRSFQSLWDNINASRGHNWDANPWVAAYTFRPVLGNIDQVRS